MHHSINSMRFIGFIFIASAFASPLWAAAKAGPASKPATRAAVTKPAAGLTPEAKANLAVTKAVTALRKGYAAHQKDVIAPRREESDYCAEQAAGVVPVEAIPDTLAPAQGDGVGSVGAGEWPV